METEKLLVLNKGLRPVGKQCRQTPQLDQTKVGGVDDHEDHDDAMMLVIILEQKCLAETSVKELIPTTQIYELQCKANAFNACGNTTRE